MVLLRGCLKDPVYFSDQGLLKLYQVQVNISTEYGAHTRFTQNRTWFSLNCMLRVNTQHCMLFVHNSRCIFEICEILSLSSMRFELLTKDGRLQMTSFWLFLILMLCLHFYNIYFDLLLTKQTIFLAYQIEWSCHPWPSTRSFFCSWVASWCHGVWFVLVWLTEGDSVFCLSMY